MNTFPTPEINNNLFVHLRVLLTPLQCQVLDIKFIVLSNNVSIGAATSSIMNAELAVAQNVL
jgi:aspartate-semialdehyde dehydrogenase